jgi:hypothetical protein
MIGKRVNPPSEGAEFLPKTTGRNVIAITIPLPTHKHILIQEGHPRKAAFHRSFCLKSRVTVFISRTVGSQTTKIPTNRMGGPDARGWYLPVNHLK